MPPVMDGRMVGSPAQPSDKRGFTSKPACRWPQHRRPRGDQAGHCELHRSRGPARVCGWDEGRHRDAQSHPVSARKLRATCGRLVKPTWASPSHPRLGRHPSQLTWSDVLGRFAEEGVTRQVLSVLTRPPVNPPRTGCWDTGTGDVPGTQPRRWGLTSFR